MSNFFLQKRTWTLHEREKYRFLAKRESRQQQVQCIKIFYERKAPILYKRLDENLYTTKARGIRYLPALKGQSTMFFTTPLGI